MRFVAEKIGVATLVITICAIGFFYVEKINAGIVANGGSFAPLHTFLDDYIPFIPQFIWTYYLYYIWIILIIPILHDRQSFYQAVGAFSIIQAAAIAIYMMWPSQMIRPEVIGDTLAHDLTRWMYHLDAGFNIMPSMHVGHSVLIALFYWQQKSKLAPIMTIGTVLISMSTVLVKQHYIIDLPAGLLLAFGAYYLSTPIKQYVSVEERSVA